MAQAAKGMCVRCVHAVATTKGVPVPYEGQPLCQPCRDVLDEDDRFDAQREADAEAFANETARIAEEASREE